MRDRTNERRHEPMEEPGHPAGDERHEPRDEGGEHHEHRPERQPQEVRDDEREPKEDEEARPAEVVVDGDPDGMRRQLGQGPDLARGGIRVPARQHQGVCGRLGAVADRVDRGVAHPARHAAAGQRTRTSRACRSRR